MLTIALALAAAGLPDETQCRTIAQEPEAALAYAVIEGVSFGLTDGLNALSAISTAAQNNTADGTIVATAAQYDALGITGISGISGISGTSQPTLTMINSVLNDADIGSAQTDTAAKVQAIVDAYAAILQSADGVANNDSVNPTQAQYATLGINGVDTAQELSLLGDVLDTASRNGVATNAGAVHIGPFLAHTT